MLTWVTVTPDSTPPVDTATGTLLFTVDLFPSWPLMFHPQQYTAPAESTAHAKLSPVLTWVRVTPDGTPPVDTATGTLLFTVELFPSWPLMFHPQQYTAPAELTAHAKLSPVLTWVRVTPDGTPPVDTATGTLLFTVELFPSWP